MRFSDVFNIEQRVRCTLAWSVKGARWLHCCHVRKEVVLIPAIACQ